MNIEILGYHGTTQKAANLIMENSSFNKSSKKNEWLGHGVYFYDLFEKAQWWCENKNEPVIIETPISVQENKLVNLDKPSEEDKFGEFIRFMERQEGFVFDSNETIRRCQMMTVYMQYVEAQVIIGTLLSTNKKYKNEFKRIGYARTEKQICVHDTACIVYNKLRVVG
ncbi:hypothetical protein I6G41_03495 [Staphylococcus equorum]|uniref:hypothetical protein n=1 Tax=Staphylococcus equorum TaxID=246432 RepID=UPI0018D61C6F|nr:hypothetical protein [Staphylococcus equorum]QPT00137.1 hypothetical protein I6G41_03495 [Staphylococcus equorum]